LFIDCVEICVVQFIITIIIIIIGSKALGGPWPPQANVASDLYAGHPPASFYNPVSLRLPLPPGFVHSIFLGNSFRPFAQHGLPTSVYWILLR
jgi:hypothetical protein